MLAPDIRSQLRAIACQLDAAGHGERGPIVEAACSFYGWSTDKLYTQLRTVGWSSGRKARADKGSTAMDTSALLAIGAMQKESIRKNGKQTMKTPVSVSIAVANDIDVPVSNRQVGRLLKARRLDVAAAEAANPHVTLRALYPNHVHQADPSLCLVYYLKGRQHIMRDDEFYKNKLENYAKVQFKVWRYTAYDKASGVIAVRYFQAAGENQQSLFEFLTWVWAKKAEISWWGVPKILLWDKGSANTAGAICNFLDALEVQYITHAAGNARAKGGVENANNIVETQFECRLRFEPVEDVDELNAAAIAWQEAYCANTIPRLDTRIERPGIGRVARYALWQKIRSEQLRELPDDIEALRALLEGKEIERKVQRDLTISYKHPRAASSQIYDVRGLDGVNANDFVKVRPLVYGNCAINITVPRFDGEALTYRLEPEFAYDEFGQPLNAAIIGEEYKALPATDAAHAAKSLDATAYPNRSADEIRAARDKGTTPFDGAMNAHGHLKDIAQQQWMPKKGSEILLPARMIVEEQPLSVAEIARALRNRGIQREDLYAWVQAQYPEGAPESALDDIAQRLQAPAVPALRAVGGM
jgi:hypothetical protein